MIANNWIFFLKQINMKLLVKYMQDLLITDLFQILTKNR